MNTVSDCASGWVARAGVAVLNRDDLVQEVLIVVVRKVGELPVNAIMEAGH